ncbi:hypothetical protein FIBSPDRAFT_874050 [Athelia psychrophila]|uniref:Uncharacterized protein n=1 Tax=Athelia psychrophila TaxID=1759441 RepID=A0A165XX01_9AGAM|nr:hypothetical protein FIBSPDRAFT_874050 [Fibularhizoctonia sp. CBS 109695]
MYLLQHRGTHATALPACGYSSKAVIEDVRSQFNIRSQEVKAYLYLSPRPSPCILASPPRQISAL